MILGVVTGLLCLELGLRLVSSGSTNLERLPKSRQSIPIPDDSDRGPSTEVRYYHEGVATSHFSAARARLTGNPHLDDAPTGVIMGDSMVEALQVSDAETMGAVVEREARSSGRPLNVRQYGWSGASVNRYVSLAGDVLTRWSPPWVAVILNESDLVEEEWPTERPGVDGPSPSPVGTMRTRIRRRLNDGVNELMGLSVLTAEVLQRLSEISRGGTAPDALKAMKSAGLSAWQTPVTPAEAVGRLAGAYGARLILLFVLHDAPAGELTVSPLEAQLLSECAAQGVRCESTRNAMAEEYATTRRFVRGFSNTAPNVGHPSANGHRVIGDILWHIVSRESEQGLLTGDRR